MRSSAGQSCTRSTIRWTAAVVVCASLLLAGVPSALAETLPRLRVVVELDLSTLPEGWLDADGEVDGQRLEILWSQLLLGAEMEGRDFRVLRRYRSVPFLAAELSVSEIEALATNPWVRKISGDDPIRPTLHQSTNLVEAPRVWPGGLDGSGWTVAVLDTGVDAAHPHLADKVVAEACFSGNGSCPSATASQTGPGAGVPCDYSSHCAHGTHVAGIAAGRSEAMSGVAPGAKVISVQVFSRFDDAPYCSAGQSCPLAFTSDLIAGLEHVYALRGTHDIAAVNMSLGGGYYREQKTCDAFNSGVKAAIDNLRSVGIATVAASGNDGFTDGLGSPACISSAVSVGSTTKSSGVSFFSNTASFLSMLAPGTGILSSVPGGDFANMSGTSMATPHVSGAWAIMKQADPLANVDAVLNRLRKTGRQIDDPEAGITRRLIQLDGATAATAVDALHDVRVRNLRKKRTLRPDDTVKVRWRSTPGVAAFDLAFTLDGGVSWTTVAVDLPANQKKTTWVVPRLASSSDRVKVRVQGYDSAGEKVATDRNGAWLRYRP